LLPPGAIWDRALERDLAKFLEAIGEEWARVHNRGRTLVDEMDPRTAVELLPDWERLLGLPDPCVPPASQPTTISDRQEAAYAALISAGGQTADYFVEVAAALGITITIDETPYPPFLVQVDTVESPVNPAEAIFIWRVDAPASTPTAKRDQLECLFDRRKPAHTQVEFVYS
jgi:uncharacterized protein YmfQ (DUF2313 family)